MPSRRELANAIRALSMDAVQQANSGHPGAPMGMADIAEVLWRDYMQHNPADPGWINRDRFVLSNGHGSMLIYSLLHLTGYDVAIDDIKNFRQLHSKTPGHPEHGYTPGIETTTGPLGQGIANAIGMALAEKVLAAQFNRPGHEIIDHHTYCFLGDGCLMEGISHEVCSLAGTLKLGKLIAFYDDNGISIDGKVEGWFTDDTPGRFEAYGWHVVRNVDGHDAEAVKRAIEAARAETGRPSLICCKTIIGFGAPNVCGTHGVHGAPLGGDEIQATREYLGWQHGPFEVPAEIYSAWNAKDAGAAAHHAWQARFDAYAKAHPEMAADLQRRLSGELPESWPRLAAEGLEAAQSEAKAVATRKASEMALDHFGPYLPELLGGSADLTGSNNTKWRDCAPITGDDAGGNYIYYGVREFGMSAIMNGVALYGGFVPYGGTFLVFSDYARNAIRMAALMKQRSIFVLTHDSIGLGEDGPTHQPIEHVASLRLIPNMSLWRPCDTVETMAAWQAALERRDGPTCLALTRQGLPCPPRDAGQLAAVRRGGYVLRDCDGEPEVILIATGSEVKLAMEAAEQLQGRKVRVVSMPSVDTFLAQDQAYRDEVLPPAVRKRVAIEAGVTEGWHRFVGGEGRIIGMDRFGESAPGNALFNYFGFTVEKVIEAVESLG